MFQQTSQVGSKCQREKDKPSSGLGEASRKATGYGFAGCTYCVELVVVCPGLDIGVRFVPREHSLSLSLFKRWNHLAAGFIAIHEKQ